MAKQNRRYFGLSTVTFHLGSTGAHIFTSGDVGSIALAEGRTSVDNQTSSGVRVGEHTSMREAEITVSGLMDLTPSAMRIIKGYASIASGAIASAAAKVLASVHVNTAGQGWTGATFVLPNSVVPGVYQVTTTDATTISAVKRLGNLRGGASYEDTDITDTSTVFTSIAGGPAAGGVALVSVEPVTDEREEYVAGRPGVNPPVVGITALSDPSSYSNADERNAIIIHAPACICQSPTTTLTAREMSTADFTFKALYDTGINGHWKEVPYEGISQS